MTGRISWRRGINRRAASISAILGILVIFSGVIFFEDGIAQCTVITVGILVIEAGVWYMANPFLTNERYYTELRNELESFIGLVRKLNTLAAKDSKTDEFELARTAMHESVERMCRLAGAPDAPAVSVDVTGERDCTKEEASVT